MSDLGEREKAFESKFGHDEETQFKIAGRAAKLFGLWAAGQLGLKDAAAETYAQQAVNSIAKKTGHDELLAKVEKDLQAKSVSLSRHRLEKEMNGFYQAAQQQIGA